MITEFSNFKIYENMMVSTFDIAGATKYIDANKQLVFDFFNSLEQQDLNVPEIVNSENREDFALWFLQNAIDILSPLADDEMLEIDIKIDQFLEQIFIDFGTLDSKEDIRTIKRLYTEMIKKYPN